MKKCIYLILVGMVVSLMAEGQALKPRLINTVFKRDTSFSCITVDTANGTVYAGTQGQGLWRYKNGQWSDFNGVFGKPAFIKSRMRQVLAVGTRVWVANSGYVLYLGSGEAGNNNNFYGGVHSIASSNAASRKYYKGRAVLGQIPSGGPPTRNILGVWVDSTGTAWSAGSYHDSLTYPAFLNFNPRYHYAPGAIGRNPNPGPVNSPDNYFFINAGTPDPDITIGVGNNYKDESWSIGKRRTIRCIAQVGTEMWAGSDGYTAVGGSIFTAGILRYDLAGNYLGKWDQANTPIPFGTTNTSTGPWAIHKDSKNRVWINLLGNLGTAVYENGAWTYIGIPPNSVPTTSVFQAHAIASSKGGQVYFGTNNGLLVYKGRGSYTSDTSYYVYNTTDGLPGNFIRGISVDKAGTIWLATGTGVVRILIGDLFVYNQKPTTTDLLNVTDDDRFRVHIAAYNSQSTQEELDAETLYIAADGSRATIFRWAGSNPNNIKFRIKEDINSKPDEFGYFVLRHRTPANDSIRVQYYHPKFIDDLYTVTTAFNGREATLQLVDTTVNPEKVVLEKKIKFILPPLMLVHGIWSKGAVWEPLKTYLTTGNGLYRYKDYQIHTPSYPNDRPFESNMWYIKSFIDELLQNCRENKFSAGKVDVVVHSMGGILSRLYLQGTAQQYARDINKLITLNTPHSGSPMANILVEKDDVLKWVMSKVGYNPVNGALGDLSIGKAPIDDLLNGPRLNANKVPSYAIRSVAELPSWMVWADQKVTDWIKKPITLEPKPYFNVVASGGARLNPYILGVKAAYVGIKYYLTKHTTCSWDENLNVCLQRIFNGPSDLIVSDISQKGGLTATQQFGNANHLEVHSVSDVKAKVINLLRESALSDTFSTQGYAPVRLRWDPVLGTQPNTGTNVASETLTIVSPVTGTAYNRGDSVSVVVRMSPGIKRALILMSYENDIDAFAIETPDSVFGFRVPADVMSRINYKIVGFDNAQNTYDDSSYITIGAQAGLVLDSIKADRDNDIITIRKGDSTNLLINGYYSDGVVRNLSFEPGFTYTYELGSIASVTAPNKLKGVNIGMDLVTINYGGKKDSMYVDVLPPLDRTVTANPIPVTFTDIYAQYRNSRIEINWSTETEINNKEFEVQRSADGVNFETFAKVPGKLFSTGTSWYAAFDYQYITGRNYYRIKQVDIDANFKYSRVVMVLIKDKAQVILYPNPARTEVNISIGGQVNANAVRLVNTMGQTVLTRTLTGNSQTINIGIGQLPSGVYFTELLNGKNESVWRGSFVKE
jgi:pimeloyl-ACP methyl ester carboxylesterase